MKKKIAGGFQKLSLTQQVICLVLLTVAFLTLFFIFFLSGNINDTISGQIFDMIAARQRPVVSALDMGKSASFDAELFDYLASDTQMSTFIINDESVVLISSDEEGAAADGFGDSLLAQAREMLLLPGSQVRQASVNWNGHTMYYRMQKTDYKGSPSVVVTFMNDTYAESLRTSLMDSTIYVTVLALFLILMIFLFWVFTIIHPLNQIKNYISQIKQGKDVDLYINREDEIGEVAQELRTLREELNKQEKAKEEMIHNISHDLKTPIATIKSYSESIKDGIYPYGDLDSSVDVILDNAKRLEDKVHSLLYMNRVEYLITSDAEGVVTNMKDVVEQVVLNSAVIRPEIEIITDVEEVFFDGLLESWRVCVENIMENAFRYAKTYIKISVHENEMIIRNDGPKMPEDRIDSLFKPYIKGEGGRFGLGLSIVSKVVAANKYKVQGLNTEDGVAFRIWRDVPKEKNNRFKPGQPHWNPNRPKAPGKTDSERQAAPDQKAKQGNKKDSS